MSPFLIVLLVPLDEFVRNVEQGVVNSHKSSQPFSQHLLYVNAREIHGSQRNGIRWLHELCAVRFGSVRFIAIGDAFKGVGGGRGGNQGYGDASFKNP